MQQIPLCLFITTELRVDVTQVTGSKDLLKQKQTNKKSGMQDIFTLVITYQNQRSQSIHNKVKLQASPLDARTPIQFS